MRVPTRYLIGAVRTVARVPSTVTFATLGDLRAALERWTTAGLITPEQGEAIARLEATGAGATPGSTGAPPRRLSMVMELMSYLGIVLVTASGAVAVSRLWHGLSVGGRVSVGVVVAALGLAGGSAVMRLRDESSTRLGWFLWLCGTGGVAMATAVLVDRLSGHDAGATVLVTGLAVLAVSLGLWRNLERPLQFASALSGLGLGAGGAIDLTNWHPSAVATGALVWGLSLALGLLSIRLVHPGLMALLVAQVGAFGGAMTMTESSRALGVTLGALVALAGVALGLTRRSTPVVGVGVLTFFVVLVRLLSYYLRGPVTLLVAFGLGVGLVGAVIWRATHHETPGGPPGAPRAHH